VTTAVAVFWDAVNSVYDLWAGQASMGGAAPVALWIALLTVGLKIGLTWFTRRIGDRIHNPAVQALAYDHRNDVFSALAAAVGIFVGRIGYPWVDPLAGALVALVILRTGIEILREASAELMDTVPGKALEQQVTDLAGAIPGVQEIEDVRAHRFGPYLVINLTIGIDGSLSVAAGDSIATRVERALYEQIGLLRQVYVHYHPVRSS
jgi:cation diffusion facilitator family transporter